MPDETPFGRLLWVLVLVVVVAIVIFSFARHPLLAGDEEASGFSRPLTLWVAGAEGDGQAEAVARELAGCWQVAGRSVTVGTLPGGSAAAVVDFLDRVHDTPNELLLVTSTTLSDIARDLDNPLLPEPRERAQRAVHLLTAAAPIAVLGGERLALAVHADSSIHTTSELLSLLREQPSRPLFGVAADTWLEGNLAALVNYSGLHGSMPYGIFTSSRSAVQSLDAGEVKAVLAPFGAINHDLRRGRLRRLPWPHGATQAPHTWVAIVAPAGLSAHAVRGLREQTRGLCVSAGKHRLLREQGVAPIQSVTPRLADFISNGVSEAVELQALAARTIHAY